MNWKQYLTIAAMYAASLFGATGCATAPPVETPKTQAQQIADITDKFASVKADKKITPQEAQTLADIGSQIDKLQPTVTDENLKAYLAGILKEADSYTAQSDKTIQAYLVLALRTDAVSPIRVIGMQQNNHIAIKGTLDEHVAALGINKKAVTTQEGSGWGYAQGDAANVSQIKSISVEVPEENWSKVADYFVDGKIKEGDNEMSGALYRIKLDKNQVVSVRLVYAKGDVSLE